MLDEAGVPVLDLAAFTTREASRPRPAYLAHRWFARRFGTAMRALLVAAATPAGGDFWDGFYGESELDLSGLTVLDPFVGGGTVVYEASRLGANVVGVDVDPVACAITSFELRASEFPDPTGALDDVWRAIGKDLASSYATVAEGEERVGLHYLWVQRVDCFDCGEPFDAHPTHLLGVDGTKCWLVCPACGEVCQRQATVKTFACACGARSSVQEGAGSGGVAVCPRCESAERLIDLARRTEQRPTFRMFAVESIPADHKRRVPLADRRFSATTDVDRARFSEAASRLDELRDHIPKRIIPRGDRSDNRLLSYGYRRYSELFNDRQLVHLVSLARAIKSLDPAEREMLGLALSNHTTSNCMMTSYSPKWRQATPLFVVRSFRHSPRPVELNPWLAGIGRGTFPNSVRKVNAARKFAIAPLEFTATGFRPVPMVMGGTAHVFNGDSRTLSMVPDSTVDLVVTDPPYMDNIAYTELADWFVPWLADSGVIASRRSEASKSTLAARARDSVAAVGFTRGLSDVFKEVNRVLRPRGRFVFTFQHRSPNAWKAIAGAIGTAGYNAVTVFPMKGDGDKGLHHHDGTSTWDAVFVFRPGNPRSDAPSLRGPQHLALLESHASDWSTTLGLTEPDRIVIRNAALVAGSAGLLATKETVEVELGNALANPSECMMSHDALTRRGRTPPERPSPRRWVTSRPRH